MLDSMALARRRACQAVPSKGGMRMQKTSVQQLTAPAYLARSCGFDLRRFSVPVLVPYRCIFGKQQCLITALHHHLPVP